MNKEEILLAQKEFIFPSVFHYFKEPLVMSHAKDQYVWDIDGNQYLDFFGGIVTVSVGHCNDQVNAKVHAQLDKMQHVSTVFANEPQVALAKRLAQITPRRRADQVVLHQQRHRSQRDRDPGRPLLYRRQRDRRAAAFLSRAQRRSP